MKMKEEEEGREMKMKRKTEEERRKMKMKEEKGRKIKSLRKYKKMKRTWSSKDCQTSFRDQRKALQETTTL
jgi:hypothetical protein